MKEHEDNLTAPDGRKITSFSASGESYTVETTRDAAEGKKAELEARLLESRARFNPLAVWNGRDRSARR